MNDDDLREYLEDMEDPLGIGSKDNNKRSEISKSKKIKGTNPTLENFDPIAYLVHVHMNTPMEDIVTGKLRLEHKVTSRQKQLEFLVKDNFSSFVTCKDAIDVMHQKLESEKSSKNPIQEAHTTFQALLKKSHELFDDLISKQNEIDQIRNVLSILKRSQFIFNLPKRMRDNIAKGEYSKVVLNYKRVKSLVASASHASIKNVLSEVETIVKDLRKGLFESLQNQTLSLKQQEDVIRLLLDLGSPVDPAWHCIILRYEKILSVLAEKIRFPQEILGYHSNNNVQSQILQVSQALTSLLPDFWYLVKSFFEGVYHRSLSDQRRAEIKVVDPNKEFSSMMNKIFEIYSDFVMKYLYGTDAFLHSFSSDSVPDVTRSTGKGRKESKSRLNPNIDVVRKLGHRRSTSDGPASMGNKMQGIPTKLGYYNEPIRETENEKDKVLAILNLYMTLTTLRIPSQYISIVGELLDEATRLYVSDTFSDIMKDAQYWYNMENWEIVEQQYMTTALPNHFKNTCDNVLSHLEGVVKEDDPIIVYIQKKLLECIDIFADNMHHLAFVEEHRTHTYEESDEKEEFSADSKLLIILNNCAYTRLYVIKNVNERFLKECKRQLYYNPDDNGALMKHLEDMILNRYIRNKTLSLNKIIREGLGQLPESPEGKVPKSIRDYAFSLLLQLVFTHDELYRISKTLIHYVLSALLENAFQTFLETVSVMDIRPIYTSIQIGMEIEFISFVMRKYKTQATRALYTEIDGSIQYSAFIDQKSNQLTVADKKQIRSTIASHQNQTQLMFGCFTVGF